MAIKDTPSETITGAKQAPLPLAFDLKDGLVLLPRFVIRRSDGLYVDISMLESTSNFSQFVDRVFGSDAYFDGLNYPLLLKLLFEPEAPELMAHVDSGGSHPTLRLARDVVPFKEERRSIYHPVKVSSDGTAAEYFFAPVSIDHVVVEPVFGPPEEDGSQPVLRYESKTVSVRTKLDVDEFVAAMWLQGIRYGLDMKAVQAGIDKEVSERREIAREKKLVAGTDASIKEQSTVLHRDDAPKILSNGRIDLRQFNNHFPQVDAGKKLLRKTPRVLGEPGFNVTGQVFEPDLPKDFDIDAVAGPGTRVERTGEGEFIVAAITGFVNIDTESNLISVTEKIVNRQGISLRTTGDLALSGADFEEHGEVQERRLVKGHNMNFLSDVFGEVTSDGGVVHLHEALAGGAVRNPRGSILIDKSASRSVVDAKGGSVEIGTAESCLIMGSQVRVQRAINCDIVADEVWLGSCEGCAVAGRKIDIVEAASRKDIETVITQLLPDSASWDKDIAALAKKNEELAKAKAANLGMAAQIGEQPEVKKFLGLQQRIKSGQLVLSQDQESGWRAAQSKFSAVTRQLDKLDADLGVLLKQELELKAQSELVKEEKRQAVDALTCQLAAVKGQTIVRTMRVPTTSFPLESLSAKELHHLLRLHGTEHDRLFSAHSGEFSWSGKDLQGSSS